LRVFDSSSEPTFHDASDRPLVEVEARHTPLIEILAEVREIAGQLTAPVFGSRNSSD
jgi:hypothetical protein